MNRISIALLQRVCVALLTVTVVGCGAGEDRPVGRDDRAPVQRDEEDDRSAASPLGPGPRIAFRLEGEDDRVRVILGDRQLDLDGSLAGTLDNGWIVVDRFPEGDGPGSSTLVDPETGRRLDTAGIYDPRADEISGHADGFVVVRRPALGEQSVSMLDLDLEQKWTARLSGRAPDWNALDGTHAATQYTGAVAIDGAVLMRRYEFAAKALDSGGDAVVRVTSSGEVTPMMQDLHVGQLLPVGDDRVVAQLNTEGLLWEAVSEVRDLVEIDPRSGAVTRRLGLPQACAAYIPIGDDNSCLEALDLVDHRLLVTISETSGVPHEAKVAAYSTWERVDGSWREVKELRNMTVRWQADGRFVQDRDLDWGDEHTPPLRWVTNHGEEREYAVADPWSWDAPGSPLRR